MNLKNLSDTQLLANTKNWVHAERSALNAVLHHLLEIERRRLFSDLRYSSLFEYAVKELKYSESQAVRRISAMRLMREIPAIESQIKSGSLSLTNLAMAQSVFRGSPHSTTQKVEVLRRLENKSTREAEKILNKRKEPGFEIFDDELRAKLLRVKGKLAHKYPNLSLTQLLHLLCDRELEDGVKHKGSRRVMDLRYAGGPPSAPKVNSARPVAQRECSNCGSVHAIQVDHIIPRALGGSNEKRNLRILCRSCNQRAAIKSFGLDLMAKYLDPRVGGRFVKAGEGPPR